MEMMAALIAKLNEAPELLLFASLALGFTVGRARIGAFRLGGVFGSLLAALLFAQLGTPRVLGFESAFLPLCTYAVGYESAPRLRDASKRKLRVALFFVACTLLLSWSLVASLGLDGKIGAGIASGVVASPLLGAVAADYLLRSPEHVSAPGLVIAFALAYVIGRFVRDYLLEHLASPVLRAPWPDASRVALPTLVGRAYVVDRAHGKTVARVEQDGAGGAAIELVERNTQRLERTRGLVLHKGDRVIVAGHRAGVLRLGQLLGHEDPDASDPGVPVEHARVMLTAPALQGRTLGELRMLAANDGRHGVSLANVRRNGSAVRADDSLRLEYGDVVELYGLERELGSIVKRIGRVLHGEETTDFVVLGCGMALGLTLGQLAQQTLNVPLTPACATLLFGIASSCLHRRHASFAPLPAASIALLKELGLAGSLSVIGLQTGPYRQWALSSSPLAIVLTAVGLSVALLALTGLFGRRVLGYRDGARMARSLADALRGAADSRAEAVPTDGLMPTISAIAGVAFTLLGPLLAWLL
jgi:uncharacterized transporter YbjL